MKLTSPTDAENIAGITGGDYRGPDNLTISGINEIHKVEEGDLTFVDAPKYYDKVLNSPATLILINQEKEPPEGKGIIICDDPFSAYNKIVENYRPSSTLPEGAYTSSNETDIDPSALIYPGVIIGNRVSIGKNSIIHPNVVIYDNAYIGENVTIHANCTIGADAFYFKKRDNGFEKLQSCGSVVIEDYVEIGANSCIDKGVSGKTIIGQGTIIDNQVHIGHGVELGKNCLLAGQVGIGGKTIIEDNVTIWGQVGITKDIRIAEGVELLAQAGATSSIYEKGRYFGTPAGKALQKHRESATLKKLTEQMSKKQ